MALLTAVGGSALAAPLHFEYVAHVDSSDRPGAPNGSLLTGRFSYDPDAIARQVGESKYYPEFGSASMSARGSNGFSLSMNARVIVVTAGAVNDTMTIQSFESESANDWHMVIDFIEPGGANGWLMGDSSLPVEFPDPLNAPFMSIDFTDDFEWVRTIDATLLSVTPVSAVPLPPSVALLLSGLLVPALAGRRKREPSSIV